MFARALLTIATFIFTAHAEATPTLPAPLSLTQEVSLSSGRRAVVEIDFIKADAAYLVILPGSGCGRFWPKDSFVVRTLRDVSTFNVVVINKAGVAVDGSCARQSEFEFSSVREQRIDDILKVMQLLVPQHARILLLGESEGGYITPDVAVADSRVGAMLWISGGSRSWIDEEISFVASHKRANLLAFFDREVRPNPTLTKKYNGWTYAQLVSFDNDKTIRAFRALRAPALLLNGELDKNTWVDGTAEDLRGLINAEKKTNLEFHLFDGADHGLGCGGAFTPRSRSGGALAASVSAAAIGAATTKSSSKHLRCNQRDLEKQMTEVIADFVRRHRL